MPVLWWMRAVVATGIAFSLAALAGGAQAREVSIYRGKCGEVVPPNVPTGFGTSVNVATTCGRFVMGPHGVRFAGPLPNRPSYVGLVGGRGGWLNFYERGRIRWQSHRSHQWAAGTSDGRSLAFLSSRGRLYLTDLMRPEHAVGARFENPLGWTRAGLLITRKKYVLLVRTRSGRLVGKLASRDWSQRYDEGSRTLLYVTPDGALVRTDGQSMHRLARQVERGIEIVPLEDKAVALLDRQRLTVLGSDGSVSATDLRRGSLPAISARGDAIAIISTGPLDRALQAQESVRFLRSGEHSSTLLYMAKVGALGCGHWPTLAWRGDELLYSTSEGHVVVLKPGSGERVDLTAVARRLPGESLEARWD
jgi:hypothetical protein